MPASFSSYRSNLAGTPRGGCWVWNCRASARSAAMPEAGAGAPKLVLAFDFGRKRIGAACGDTVSRTAAPLQAVPAGPGGPRWEAIDSLMRDWQPAVVGVGLPYNVDDSESGMTGAARIFAAEIARRYAVQVALIDERYSSLEVES